jgi:hypothetical protein
MRADPILTAVSVMNPSGTYSLTTPAGEYLMLDQAARLEKGCTVAVFLSGHFMLVGRIERRPVPHRRLVIRCRNIEGVEYVTRIYGLRDADTQIWRVMGVFTPVPFADVDDRDAS